MKRACVLLLFVLSLVAGVVAQQQVGTEPQNSNSAGAAKAAKKSAKKAKTSKKQNAAVVDSDGIPPARARHMRELMRTVPGNGGEANNGAAGAAEDAFQQRAFPDSDIPLDRLLAARAAAANLNSRKFPTGKGRPGTWVTVGPSEAIYPLTPLRTSAIYVPNKYDAASRTTSLAISPVCLPGNCTLWATPAGGGVWRTKNALDGEPSWTYLSSTFAINSVGSITPDPNDPTGNTLWVGTGEANACGSGCEAGVGLYKSTDGGDTWTGPIGASVFNARGVSTIAIKPGDPNTIFAGSTRAIRGVASVCCDGAVSLIPGAAKWGTIPIDGWRQHLDLCSQRLRRPDPMPRERAGGRQRNAMLAARGTPRAFRSLRPEHGVCSIVRAWRLAFERRRHYLGANQAFT